MQRRAEELTPCTDFDHIRPADRGKAVTTDLTHSLSATGSHNGFNAQCSKSRQKARRQSLINRYDARFRFQTQRCYLACDAHRQIVAVKDAPPSGNAAHQGNPTFLTLVTIE